MQTIERPRSTYGWARRISHGGRKPIEYLWSAWQRRDVVLTMSEWRTFQRIAKGHRMTSQRALAAELGLSLSTLNHHLRRLRSWGVIGVGTRRGCHGGTWVWAVKANVQAHSLWARRRTPVDASTVVSSPPPQRKEWDIWSPEPDPTYFPRGVTTEAVVWEAVTWAV